MMLQLFKRLVVVVLLAGIAPVTAMAVQPDEILKDPALEHRARVISEGLRCLVCQNQSIDDSDAALAKDLRLLVRERLKAGDSNEQVLDYVVARYGDFVLLKPPLKPETIALWVSPFVVLLLGIWLSRRTLKARRETIATEAPLSADEKARLDALLRKSGS